MMMLKTGSKESFTLVELLLVMVVILVLAGVSIPSLKNSARNAEFKGFINKLYLFLDYARSRSTLENSILAVNIDNEGKILLIQEKDTELNHIGIPADIQIQSNAPQVLFYPDGTSQQFELLVQAGQDQHSIILSRGFDGKIKIKDYATQNN